MIGHDPPTGCLASLDIGGTQSPTAQAPVSNTEIDLTYPSSFDPTWEFYDGSPMTSPGGFTTGTSGDIV